LPVTPLNGVELYHEDHGDGPAVVLCHGGGLSHVDFFQQVPFLVARGFRVVVFDQRGHGLSGGAVPGTPAAEAAAAQGLDVFANDALALMDHLGIDDAVVIGMSMGGWNASRLALTATERVRAMIMIGSSFGLPTEAQQEWARWMIGRIEADDDPVVAERTTPQQLRFRARRPDLAFLRDELAALFPAREVGRGTGVYRLMEATPPGDFSAFPVPSLFLVGDDDALQVPWLIDATAAAVAGSELVHVADAGHCCHFEQADVVNAALLDFLRRHG
jgi:3-oxoadipate enol-lactonase